MNERVDTSKPGAASAGPSAGTESGIGSGRGEKLFAVGLFHVIERLLLVVIVALTLVAVVFEIRAIYHVGTVLLADILLMFLYLEVIGMVSVYYARRDTVFVYPIFIAITAVGRLVVLQGKEMAPENILIPPYSPKSGEKAGVPAKAL